MDKTETYIRMSDCPEIQQDKPNVLGAWSLEPSRIEIQGDGSVWYGLIWLPRQDDLQEMIGDFEAARDLIAGYFSNMDEQPFLFKDGEIEYWESFTSMEQLWLAFYMSEKHNKVWNGDKWV